MFLTNEAHEQCFFLVFYMEGRDTELNLLDIFSTHFLGRNNACMDIKKRQNVPFVIPIGS